MRGRKILGGVVVIAGAVYLLNASWLAAPAGNDSPRIIAHRGVHQTFSHAGVDAETCTASRIDPLTHDFMENTITSMRAAFAAGADVVELDVHLTPDKVFAVLHDWTLDCRTDGHGVTEQTPWPTLKTLDVGYGYTADGGKTFPLRGKGVGLMPRLDEVYAAFPDRSFLVNFKSRRTEEGEALAALINIDPKVRAATFGVYGGEEPTRAAEAAVTGLKGFDKSSLKACLVAYEAYGWTGFLPGACRNTLVALPIDIAPYVWGWPNRFMKRMRDAGSDVILVGPYGGDFTTGIDTPELAAKIPPGFDGYVWTNRIETMGPLLKVTDPVHRH
ncbi:glycerophosphodiester phosphodiesterase family protein [Pleomorphomonas carboxyditropha]|uniref:Glycerophosphodiester phosphodiesterase n=1 Tax=Pleomorphomonas carboxyditropha TaxID=2023338 RepID=A0A2G9WQE0_9HYPH|nr:glycerophosphodiester phosphodiesterase family protein [Pleomorphomonas carboxyditropha]PIO96939.1 glycerophosphodiester phosphodiesterase [Pleomorphomonas carboxyditropha]